MGFIYRGVNLYEHLANIFFICLPILFLPRKFTAPSDVLFHLIYIVVYIPSVVIISFVQGRYNFDSAFFVLNIFVSFYLMFAISRLRIPKPKIRLPTVRASLAGLCIIAAGGVVILILQMGVASSLPDFRNVYGQRAVYMEAYAQSPILPWIVGLTTQVTAPLILAYGFSKKNIIYISFGLFVQLYIFSITGLKQSIISIAYILTLYLAVNYFKTKILFVFLVGTIFSFVFGIILDYALGYDFFNGFFNRRTFMLQGLLTEIYFQFAESRGYFWWSHSVLSVFSPGTAIQSPEMLIGRLYFYDHTHANASIWADGYMNGGLVGLYIVCGITGLFLALINSASMQSDPKIVASGLGMLFMLICSTGITKVIGTHGGLLAILILAVANLSTKGSRQTVSDRRDASNSAPNSTSERRLIPANG